ncbi:hypothetical protein GCM10009764_24920 [Nocardia ninae]|uniref:Uncharacterized protein n=1 Tax=Nocardia ninae NBRC 108245 TaxID=1210091 RepID=A0A511MCA5_9NOCA|nr:hypothetical protein NN4_27790 [Nocardia ninae NBRC 108245]
MGEGGRQTGPFGAGKSLFGPVLGLVWVPGGGGSAGEPLHLLTDPARRASCELPQGRKAARVNGLCRVRGVPLIFEGPARTEVRLSNNASKSEQHTGNVNYGPSTPDALGGLNVRPPHIGLATTHVPAASKGCPGCPGKRRSV